MKDSEAQNAKFEKTFPKFPHQKKWEFSDPNTHLHKVYIPPAYMTQAGVTYTGMTTSSPKQSPDQTPTNQIKALKSTQQSSPDYQRIRKLKEEVRTSPKGIRNLNEARIQLIMTAKDKRDERRSEIFKPTSKSH